jgi:hypothetical protein
MYTLLNVLKHGLKQHTTHKKNNTIKDIDEWHRLDFLSGIYFRVFENLVCEEHDPSRFKLEIKLNRGSTIKPDEVQNIEDHIIPIKLDDCYTRILKLEDVDLFFKQLNIQEIINSKDPENITKTDDSSPIPKESKDD